MAVRAEEIASILKEQIENFDVSATSANVGTVIQAGDGIARIHGLGECLASELIEFGVTDDNGRPIRGLALNLEEETVGAIIMGDYTKVCTFANYLFDICKGEFAGSFSRELVEAKKSAHH